MACTGCLFGVGYYPLTVPPFLHAMAGFVLVDPTQEWPDGECLPKQPGSEDCLASPCYPVGQVTVANNWLGGPLRVHYHTYQGDDWADYTLAQFGEAMVFNVPGVAIPCGDAHVAAEVWSGATKVGEVRLTCSKCIHSV